MECTDPEIQKMATAVEQWANRFSEQALDRKHLIICGRSGTGKTMVARRLRHWVESVRGDLCMKFRWSHDPSSEWAEFSDLCQLESAEFKRWLDDRQDARVLFLEDIGAETDAFKSSEPAERLRRILNAFEHRWLVITTNVSPDEDQWKTRWDDRVADRLLRNSKIVRLKNTPRFSAVKGKL